MPNPVMLVDKTGQIIYTNPACQSMLAYTAEELSGHSYQELITAGERDLTTVAFKAQQSMQDTGTIENHCSRGDGGSIRVKWTISWDEAEQLLYCFGEALSAAGHAGTSPGDLTSLEREIMQLNMQPGVSTQQVADALLQGIGKLYPGAICSILRLQSDGSLRHYAAPGLPDEYIQVINGVMPGPAVGSCGTAVHYNKAVIVSDIQNNPLWQDYREIAARFGLAACWSMPIHHSNGSILGTFAVYYRSCKTPGTAELQTIERLAYLIGLLIENREMIQMLSTSEEQYRYLFNKNPLPMWIFDMETHRFLQVNQMALQQYGYTNEEFLAMTIFDIRPTREQNRLQSIVKMKREDTKAYKWGKWQHIKRVAS